MKSQSAARCPIEGCQFHYAKGIQGWYRHVSKHAGYRPTLSAGPERAQAFVADFPEFFIQAIHRKSPPEGEVGLPGVPWVPRATAAVASITVNPPSERPTLIPGLRQSGFFQKVLNEVKEEIKRELFEEFRREAANG